jgi:hypothetical protein
MASIRVDQASAKQPAETNQERFQRLASVWRAETSHLSSSTQMAAHPAYQEIISLGPEVVPLLLADLAKQPDHWFTALKTITGANPVDPADRGRIDKMAQAWLKWGTENGYRW